MIVYCLFPVSEWNQDVQGSDDSGSRKVHVDRRNHRSFQVSETTQDGRLVLLMALVESPYWFLFAPVFSEMA